jgi:hypothetical protein
MAYTTGASQGPSPRWRGNLRKRQRDDRDLGTIPAPAGEPAELLRPDCCPRDHPRAGGGTHSKHRPTIPQRGPSPRWRGNHGREVSVMTSSGTIPALAGEPLSAKQLILLKMSKSPTNHGRTAGPTCHHAETRTPSRLTSLRGGVPRVARPRPPGAVSSRHTITIEPSPVAACQSETTDHTRSRTPLVICPAV